MKTLREVLFGTTLLALIGSVLWALVFTWMNGLHLPVIATVVSAVYLILNYATDNPGSTGCG